MTFFIGKTVFRLSFSFVALIVVMVILCEDKIIIYSLISSLIHESGHLFFIFLLGDAPKRIELAAFGMRIDRADKPCISYKKEIFIALGGILFNLIICMFCLIINSIRANKILIELAVINAVITVINSFPVSDLDFGKALRFVLLIYTNKETSDRYADAVSFCFVCIFTALAVLYIVFYGVNISLIAINLYLILITVKKKWS